MEDNCFSTDIGKFGYFIKQSYTILNYLKKQFSQLDGILLKCRNQDSAQPTFTKFELE